MKKGAGKPKRIQCSDCSRYQTVRVHREGTDWRCKGCGKQQSY